MNKIVLNTIRVNTVRLNTVGEWRKSEGGGGGGSISYPGLIAAWSAKGKSNDDADRAVLKDLTGNGHDISLNGFAFAEMSGYGGYDFSFKNFNQSYHATKVYKDITEDSGADRYLAINLTIGFTAPSFKIKYTVVGNSSLKYTYYDENGDMQQLIIVKSNSGGGSGEVIIPQCYSLTIAFAGFSYNARLGSITIELIPEYPDALVFDGIDDYGINENMPILTDYTIIVKRKFLADVHGPIISKRLGNNINGAFWFERYNSSYNFGANYSYDNIGYKPYNGDISFATKQIYNGLFDLPQGTALDNNVIALCCEGTNRRNFANAAFYSAYLFDRSLDEQEIKAFIRKYIDPEYLLPSKIPTPDCYYDFSQGSNDDADRNTIKDLSGNGNNAVAHNFAWSGMSGYGGYDFKNQLSSNAGVCTADFTYNSIILSEIKSDSISQIYTWNTVIEERKEATIKVSGLSELNTAVLNIECFNNNNWIRTGITKDGIYSIPKCDKYESEDTHNMTFKVYVTNYIGSCNIVIEYQPFYEGALVFDGVDDYISLDAFDSGFKTIFMVCKPFEINKILYDQRNALGTNRFAIYIDGAVAYNSRMVGGITYINNIKNTEIRDTQLINKKHLITIYNEKGDSSLKPYIGSNRKGTNFYAKMVCYKFLGFKEALTEEQINAIIKKYNLLDGVDEIEVS